MIRRSFVVAAAASIVTLAIGASFYLGGGLPDRNAEGSQFAKAILEERQRFTSSSCLVMEGGAAIPELCGGSLAQTGPAVVLWGDSHAAQFAPVIERIAAKKNRTWRQLTKSGCPPIPTPVLFPQDDLRINCPAFNRAALARVRTLPEGSVVILAARWDAIVSGELLFSGGGHKPLLPQSLAYAERALGSTVRDLKANGVKVIVIAQTPVPQQDTVGCLSRAHFNGRSDGPCRSFASSEVAEPEAKASAFLERALGKVSDTSVIHPWSKLCAGNRCLAVVDGKPLYLDTTHLSEVGAARALGRIETQIEN